MIGGFALYRFLVQWVYMNDALYQAALRALVFFDIFDHPLTDRELFEYLHGPIPNTRLNFSQFLAQTEVFPDSVMVRTQGLWHLRGREELVSLRTERSVSYGIKNRILIRAVRVLSYVPFVRAVFVCNTLAFSVADRTSDIDVLIIVKGGRMWTARLMTTILMSVCGLRRTKKRIQDRICLSFYLADRALNIMKFRIPDDIYMSFWLRTLIPVYDPDHLRDSILRANQELLEPFLPHARYTHPMLRLDRSHELGKRTSVRIVEWVLQSRVGDRGESFVRAIQRKKIFRNRHSLVHAKDTRVVVNDSVLKFHENDRRVLYRDTWKQRMSEVNESL